MLEVAYSLEIQLRDYYRYCRPWTVVQAVETGSWCLQARCTHPHKTTMDPTAPAHTAVTAPISA